MAEAIDELNFNSGADFASCRAGASATIENPSQSPRKRASADTKYQRKGAAVAKFDFNPENYTHRLMLALAIREYSSKPGQTLAGTKKEEASLLAALTKAGIAMSKPNLDRIAAAPKPGDRDHPYGRQASQVATFLERRGHFPPAQDAANALKLLPLFFGGMTSSARNTLDELKGKFSCYQFSDEAHTLVLAGIVEIEEVGPWGFATASECIETKQFSLHTAYYHGIAFSDEGRALYMMLREERTKHPRLYIFDSPSRPHGEDIEFVYGSLLAAHSSPQRHVSPVVLHRILGPTRGELPISDKDAFPEHVHRYLSLNARQPMTEKSANMSKNVVIKPKATKKGKTEK